MEGIGVANHCGGGGGGDLEINKKSNAFNWVFSNPNSSVSIYQIYWGWLPIN